MKETMKTHDELDTRRRLTHEFTELLHTAANERTLTWSGTAADLMEAAHIAYEYGVERSPSGQLYQFTQLARRACTALHVRLPPHPKRTAWQARRRKGVRQQTLLERYRHSPTLTIHVRRTATPVNPYTYNQPPRQHQQQETMENKEEKTMLTEHFSLPEMVRSGVALQQNIDNQPSTEAVDNLRQLCRHVLEPLRRRFGRIIISSGYRSPRLNKAVGGVANSQHLRGEAADIHISDAEQGRRMYDFLRRETDFDQLIFEHNMYNGCRWLHVSNTRRRPNRHQAL